MIVKYKSDDVWGYIDHVRQVATREYDGNELIREYEVEVNKEEREDIASVYDGDKRVVDGVATSNKVFLMISEKIEDLTTELNAHAVNLIKPNFNPAYAILLYLEDTKDYDAMVLITNQKCYLMNDEGKTIERLV
ncbi:MAG TPA: hypothetical protein VN258_06260 [Mobilitalea sp.]|nr:hypothetical protein [Mobilitalea sp.]